MVTLVATWYIPILLQLTLPGDPMSARCMLRHDSTTCPSAPHAPNNFIAWTRANADLALTPAERVRRCEAMIAEADAIRPRGRIRYIVQFERLEDYLDWKSAMRAGGF